MFPRVTGVRHVKDDRLEVRFSDGTIAELDFRERIAGRGGVFQPLQEVKFFAQVTVDPEAGTLVWPNGVDCCPDVLFAEATGKSIAELGSDLEVARISKNSKSTAQRISQSGGGLIQFVDDVEL